MIRAALLSLLFGLPGCSDDAAPADAGGTDAAVDAGPDAAECGAREVCNGLDDDCDGDVDEGFDLDADPRHCGACGDRCEGSLSTGVFACLDGACAIACDPERADCNGSPEDGCEAWLGSAAHCGGCGVACAGDAPVCAGGACAAACGSDATRCGDACVTSSSSPLHCGRCGNECPGAANAEPSCTFGDCGLLCRPGFEDCNADPADGCEHAIEDGACP